MKKEKESPKKNKPAQAPRRGGTGVWIGLIVFVSAWMFILGVFVGRGTAPVQFDIQKLQKELTELKAEFVKKEQKWLENQKDTSGGKTELHFYEILKDTRSSAGLQADPKKPERESVPETDDTIRKSNAAPEGETGRIATTGSTDFTGKQPEAAAGSNGKSAVAGQGSETEETSREGTAVAEKKPGNGINLTIQVASFKDAGVADTTVAALIRKGYPAYRTIGDVQGKGTWFRVRIGNFKSREDAGPTMERLKKEGIKSILVQR